MIQPTIAICGNRASWYSIVPWASGAPAPIDMSTDTTYGGTITYEWEDLVPSNMRTGNPNLYIHSASIQIIGILLPNQDEAGLVIEAPEGSQKWKKLCNAVSGPNPYDRQAHNPPVIMTHEDYLCIARGWSDAYHSCDAQKSWMFQAQGANHKRLWTATMEYTIGE